MLTADGGLGRREQRLVIRVAVRLVDGDLAIIVRVARAAQTDEKVMREVARLELLALLRQLAARRRREHRDAGRVELLARVEREVRRWLRALHARERAALTRVEHDDGQRRGELEQPLAQLGQRQVAVAQIDRLRARVAAVIEEHARLAAGRDIGGDVRLELGETRA